MTLHLRLKPNNMPEFRLNCINKDGVKTDFYYNNDTSSLFDSKHKGVDVKGIEENRCCDIPLMFKKDLSDIKFLRIKFTDQCNYRCSYCLQSHDYDELGDADIDGFVRKLFHPTNPTAKISFWGGEPFTQWETFSHLLQRMRGVYPLGGFYVATNGSLITHGIANFLDKMEVSVSVSHDGPGQKQRGVDPLDPPQQQEIQYIFNLLNSQQKFSFNPMLMALNPSRKAINDWFLREIGHSQFTLGEGKFIYPMVPDHYILCLNNQDQMQQYALRNLQEIRHNQAPNMIYRNTALDIFRKSLLERKKSDSVVTVSVCGIHLPYRLDVDTYGNVLTCQNFSPDYIMPSGRKNKIGELGGDMIIDAPVAIWKDYDMCGFCPILHICQGGCPSNLGTEGKILECNNNFADGIGFFATVIEEITGYLPYQIDGPLPEDRKELFGTSSVDELFSM